MVEKFEGFTGRLAVAMNDKGYSQSELARASGVPLNSVNKICNGKIKQPNQERVKAIAVALGVSQEWLLFSSQTDKLNHDETVGLPTVFVIGEVMGKGTWMEHGLDQKLKGVAIPAGPVVAYQHIGQEAFKVTRSAHPAYNTECFVTTIRPEDALAAGEGIVVGDRVIVEWPDNDRVCRDLADVTHVAQDGVIKVKDGNGVTTTISHDTAQVVGIVLMKMDLTPRGARK